MHIIERANDNVSDDLLQSHGMVVCIIGGVNSVCEASEIAYH